MPDSVQEKISLVPFLKWAGGKSKLIHHYKNYFPKEGFNHYYEPFLGGGAIFFHLRPNRAILSDINSDLIEAYQCVKDKVEELIIELRKHQINHDADTTKIHKYYYDVRSSSYTTPIERAARLIYLNRTCFNGLYRVNSDGQFNVPIGRYKNPKICNEGLLRDASFALQSAQLEVRHFKEILNYAKSSDDFVYFDPPYHPLNNTSYFTAYNSCSFNEDDQKQLRDIFAQLASRGVKVMLSNSDCEFIRELYTDSQVFLSQNLPKINEILAPRAINSDTSKRGKISELLITSY